jgi:hypothetical protein
VLDSYGRFRGLVALAHYDSRGRRLTETTALKPNLVTVQGCEILARVLSGDPTYKINGVYFEFENTAGTPAAVSYTRSTTAAEMRGGAASPTKGIIRSALAAAGTLATGDSSASGLPYSNNRATFFALATSAVDSIDGSPAFSAGANSKIVSVGLVAMPMQADFTKDVLFARFTPAAPFAVQAGRFPGVTWTVELL